MLQKYLTNVTAYAIIEVNGFSNRAGDFMAMRLGGAQYKEQF